MQKNNAETGCSERWPKTCKGKEKEATGRKSEAAANFGARRTEWEEAYLPLKGGTALKCPPKRKVEMNSKVVNAEMMKERC